MPIRKALIVGINDYPRSPLRCCKNDAIALSNILKKNEDGSPNFDIALRLSVRTKSELKGMIIDLFDYPSETALFYFSGHGTIDNGNGYLVTPDYSEHDFGVSMDEISTFVNKAPITNKLIILDCCYSGKAGNPEVIGGTLTVINDGVTILTSSRKNEVSSEVSSHGVFTNLLLEGLKGGAADISGNITPGSIYSYIDQALGYKAQRPVFKTNISQFTTLRKVNPQIPLPTLRKITDYFTSADREIMLNPSFEDTNDPSIEHKVIEPYANKENVAKFKDLQKLQSVGLVKPVGLPLNKNFMYYAAMKSTSCKLTPLGQHYWELIKQNKI